MQELNGDQARQLIDVEQVFLAWEEAGRELLARFPGSMEWKTVKARKYLYRKTDGPWKCLGPQGADTDEAYERFHQGRKDCRVRRDELDATLVRMAPINRAMRLGRVPIESARVLRRIAKIGALGKGLQVVGTHALFAYERMAGVHLDSEILATRDIDLLYDARGQLDLAVTGLAETGLTGLLRKIDPSFQPAGPGSFRAVNSRGFMVDLITPAVARPASRRFRDRLGDDMDDLRAAEIEGLGWLESSPAISAVAIDMKGFPLRIAAPDPRAFACHKLWIADRQDREPIKARRDRQQARAVIAMLARHLPHLTFDDRVLEALPQHLRVTGLETAKEIAAHNATQPDWY